MLDLLNEIDKYNPIAVIALFWVLIMAVKEIFEIYKWVGARLEEWRNKKNGIERKEESADERITKLEHQNEKLFEKMDTICELLVQYQKDNDEVVVANSRATLNTLAEQIKAKGFMTESEYDTFMDLSDIYLRKNGNHSMKDKVIPYIRSLPVKTD